MIKLLPSISVRDIKNYAMAAPEQDCRLINHLMLETDSYINYNINKVDVYLIQDKFYAVYYKDDFILYMYDDRITTIENYDTINLKKHFPKLNFNNLYTHGYCIGFDISYAYAINHMSIMYVLYDASVQKASLYIYDKNLFDTIKGVDIIKDGMVLLIPQIENNLKSALELVEKINTSDDDVYASLNELAYNKENRKRLYE